MTKAEWQIPDGSMLTRWAKDVDPTNVLPEYPRPQMVRDKWLNLNGLWDYAIRPLGQEETADYDGQILVPFPVESALSGVKMPLLPDQQLCYRRTFKVPPAWQGERLLLHFGAVDWQAKIAVNGHFVGEHRGGFYPFSFEIAAFTRPGENELTVTVWDPTDSGQQQRGKQVLKPKLIFYTAASGIWQTVWLEAVPEQYIRAFKMLPDIDRQELRLTIDLLSSTNEISFEAEAYDREGKRVATCRNDQASLVLKIDDLKLWSPESPYLYDLKMRLISEGEIVDEVKSYFGMRKFSIEKDSRGVKRLFLNNQPLFQNGLLDQGYWPDGLFTAPTDEALRYDLEITRQMGFNMTRKHIKIEPARWYYHCDQLGLIVWQDMLNGGSSLNLYHHLLVPKFFPRKFVKDNNYRAMGRLSGQNRADFMQELQKMVDALYNVPSIGMWVIFNEGWGQFDAEQFYKWLKDYDPTRYIDHASGWYDQQIGDLKSVHIYLNKLAMPADCKDRAVIISEFGGYCLSLPGHLWKKGRLIGYRKYPTPEAFRAAYQALIGDQLTPLVAEGLAGAVFTQLTDVEIETNGLLTYDREVIKIDAETLHRLNKALMG
jgi:beta-galactosidase/beta-glucuronidase